MTGRRSNSLAARKAAEADQKQVHNKRLHMPALRSFVQTPYAVPLFWHLQTCPGKHPLLYHHETVVNAPARQVDTLRKLC